MIKDLSSSGVDHSAFVAAVGLAAAVAKTDFELRLLHLATATANSQNHSAAACWPAMPLAAAVVAGSTVEVLDSVAVESKVESVASLPVLAG